MANVKKFTRAEIGVVTRHFERAKNKDGEYLKWSNQDIDTSKSHLNYNLVEHNLAQLDFINNRCSEVRCYKRKDVNVMVSWVLTAPKELFETEYQKFFEEGYKFFNSKYGEENCISAYVHMDEVTPHMHYAFVPVTTDKKRGDLKVSAKEIITRNHLQTFHQELDEYMTKIFGRDIGVFSEITRDKGNLEVSELKRRTLENKLEEKNKTLVKVSNLTEKKHLELSEYRNILKQIKVEYGAKKGYLRDLRNEAEIGNLIPSYAKVNKSNIFRQEETITMPKNKWDDYVNLILEKDKRINKMQIELEKEIKDFNNTIDGQNIINLQEQIKRLEKDLKLKQEEKDKEIGKYNSLLKKYDSLSGDSKIKIDKAKKEGLTQGLEKGERLGFYNTQLEIAKNIFNKFTFKELIEFKEKEGITYFESIGIDREISRKALREFKEIQKLEQKKLEEQQGKEQQKAEKKKSIGMSR